MIRHINHRKFRIFYFFFLYIQHLTSYPYLLKYKCIQKLNNVYIELNIYSMKNYGYVINYLS